MGELGRTRRELGSGVVSVQAVGAVVGNRGSYRGGFFRGRFLLYNNNKKCGDVVFPCRKEFGAISIVFPVRVKTGWVAGLLNWLTCWLLATGRRGKSEAPSEI